MHRRRGFLGFARTVGLATLASRVLGLARDMVCANVFGAGAVWDAFIVAFRIPNLFRRMFGEGALSVAFIPVFADYLHRESRAEQRRLVNATMTTLACVLAAAVGLAILLTIVLYATFPFSEKARLMMRLLWVMLPYALLICGAALAAAILNSLGHFLVPSLAPVVLNLFWIGGALLLPMRSSGEVRIFAVAVAIVLAGIFQFGMQVPLLARRGIHLAPELRLSHPGLRRVVGLMGPVLVATSVLQINVLLDSLIAWLMAPSGAVAVLYYGDRLMEFPLGVFGISVATAVFPTMASAAAMADVEGFRRALGQALRAVSFVAVPASVGIALLARPIVDLLFLHGDFTAEAARRTAWVSTFYALGLVSYCAVHVLTRAFYSLKDTFTPVKVGGAMIACNLGLNLLLVRYMQESGLALATAVTATGNSVILLGLLRRRLGRLGGRALLKSLGKISVATAAMALGCWASFRLAPDGPGFLSRAGRVFVPMGIGLLTFIVASLAIKARELREIIGSEA